MKNSKLIAITSLIVLLVSSLAFAGGNDVAIRCIGDSNFGDDIDVEFRMNGACEGLFGKTIFCESEIIFLKAADAFDTGETSRLFVKTVKHTMIYENRVIAEFSWKGKTIDLMSWDTPIHAFDGMNASLNFGGGRSWAQAKCHRIR